MLLNSKPKILFLAPFPPPMGGIANQSQLLLDSDLFRSSFTVYPIKTNPFRISEEPGKRFRWLSLWSIKLFYRVIASCISLHPDLVFLRGNGDISLIRNGIVAILASKLSKSPLVMYIQIGKSGSWMKDGFLNKVGDWIISYIVHKADVLIHLSDAANRAFVSRGWKPSDYIIPNAVNPAYFSSTAIRYPNHFCFLGRLSTQKGFYDILHALKDDVFSNFPWTFHAMGTARSPRDRKEIDLILDSHPNRDKIVLHGSTFGEEKWRILQSCSFMVFPSHKENFPNAILEGMIARLAIIATPVGEIPNMVSSEGWITVAIGDRISLSQSILLLLRSSDVANKMGVLNKNTSEKYHLPEISEKLCNILKSLLPYSHTIERHE